MGLGESGRLVVALPRALAVLDPDTRRTRALADAAGRARHQPPQRRQGRPGRRLLGRHDGRPRRRSSRSARSTASTADGRVSGRCDGLVVSNGLAWTRRRAHHVPLRLARAVDRPLATSTRRPARSSERTRIATLDDATGRPDGAACDAEGIYWSAGVSAGRLNRWSRDGALIETHPVPVPSPTMPCFCGPDLRTLVVTSLRPGGADHIHAGGLVIAAAPIAGAPVARWMDR